MTGRARTQISRASGGLVDVVRRTARTWRAPAPPGAAADPVASWPEHFERNAPYSPTPDNRPASLDCGPLPLTRDARSQMSFGERAAFEGILAQVRPAVAIEIGTAEGGNLRRMAAQCGLVYSIDVDHRSVGEDVPANARLLTGDSARLLPDLLRSLQDTGKVVNLALVDGDHSYEGVRRDVAHLLDSPCTACSVILVHDTMNAEVRAGIESVSIDDHPGVVYYELDFVPGYVYRRGAARDTAWGGLCLILTDHQHAGGRSPRQDLYHEPFNAIQGLRATRA